MPLSAAAIIGFFTGHVPRINDRSLLFLQHMPVDPGVGHVGQHLALEVLGDALESKTKVGYEIPLNRHFHVYEPPRPLEVIEADIKTLEGEILALLKEVTA